MLILYCSLTLLFVLLAAYEIYNGISCCCALPLARKSDTPTNHNQRSLQKNKKKRESRFQRIDRRSQPISCGRSNQREPPVLPDSPSPRASADTLFLPTSRAPEEQRQSRRNHSGGKLGGKRGIGSIGRYISPRSTLRCVQITNNDVPLHW